MVAILEYQFQGPYNLGTNFRDVPAVYVVYTSEHWLDVGETDKLGERIQNHERADCWSRSAGGKNILLAVLQEGSQERRLALERYLRDALKPRCGEI